MFPPDRCGGIGVCIMRFAALPPGCVMLLIGEVGNGDETVTCPGIGGTTPYTPCTGTLCGPCGACSGILPSTGCDAVHIGLPPYAACCGVPYIACGAVHDGIKGVDIESIGRVIVPGGVDGEPAPWLGPPTACQLELCPVLLVMAFFRRPHGLCVNARVLSISRWCH